MDYIIGIDPSSSAHGVAIYHHGKLTGVFNWTLVEIMAFIERPDVAENCLFSVEDMKENTSVFRQKSTDKARNQGERGRRLGLCQQAQIELERVLKSRGIPVKLHKPQAGNWANSAKMFQRMTSWPKSGNKDNRSAAYFGYLEARRV